MTSSAGTKNSSHTIAKATNMYITPENSFNYLIILIKSLIMVITYNVEHHKTVPNLLGSEEIRREQGVFFGNGDVGTAVGLAGSTM